jgi:hypothetical protein
MQHLTRSRWRFRVWMAGLVAVALTLASGLAALANVPIVQISTDPYTNSTSTHQTEVEPDTFAYGNTIVSAFQVGRAISSAGGGCSNIGWATSTDRGVTWTHGFLPGTTQYATPPGPATRISDPVVAYDAAHNVWMIHTIPLNASGSVTSIWVSRSTDGGLTWGNPVTTYTNGTANLDKNWLACDNSTSSPYYGNCYAEWDNNGAGNLLQMQASHDGGLTWDPARTPSGAPSGLGGQPVVQSNGTVVVPYSANNQAERAIRSTDGGTSWSTTVTIATVSSHGVAGGLRTSPLPSAEVDPQGRVYVVWQDCRFRTGCTSNDIVMSTSLDGVTWSAVTRIPIDAVTSTVDHFIPGIGVDWTRSAPPAHLALAYYYYPTTSCTTGTCQLYVGFISSGDGGVTWSTATQVAGPMSLSWVAQSNQGPMVGDYISTSFSSDQKAHPAFAVANAPGAQLDEAMYAPNPGLSLLSLVPSLKPAPSWRAGGDKVVFFAPSDRPLPAGLPTAH